MTKEEIGKKIAEIEKLKDDISQYLDGGSKKGKGDIVGMVRAIENAHAFIMSDLKNKKL